MKQLGLPRAALEVWPHKKQLGFHPELFGSLRGWKLGLDGLDGLETVWGVWNQARSFGFSILIILLF